MKDARMTALAKLLQRQGELDNARLSVKHTTLYSVFKRIVSFSKEKNEDEDFKKNVSLVLACSCAAAMPLRDQVLSYIYAKYKVLLVRISPVLFIPRGHPYCLGFEPEIN